MNEVPHGPTGKNNGMKEFLYRVVPVSANIDDKISGLTAEKQRGKGYVSAQI
ncbi:MAG: hypothetical protein SPI01_02525 [Succiniclasticum sp.]|nr:hypothetical protein [Succiniclasticum sp.]MDY6086856.1 hypothetical protein [Succiniclasticum sp.]MED9854151.1 hypothetical protein [Succiniclasticum sp.]